MLADNTTSLFINDTVTYNTVTNAVLDKNSSVTNSIFNTTYPILLQDTTYEQDFFHHLTLKDETTFVALIVMGVIIPGIFIFIFILICRQRRKELLMRRTQMLLQNAQDFSMDDFPVQDKTYFSTIKL